MKESKKEILQLVKNIFEGDYKKAEGNTSTIIEHKLNERISNINKNLKSKKA